MVETEKMVLLEQENKKLQEDKEILMDVVSQMRVTLNRLMNRYLLEGSVDTTI